jgi:hypothetical protein
LGFRREQGSLGQEAWAHPDRWQAVFLGDFIDGGRENARVLDTVRAMVEAGQARAIMGNHELNALLFHTPSHGTDASGDGWLRERNDANKKQHQTFLDEFPANASSDVAPPRDARAREVLRWFMTLPLYIDLGPFRVVHAQWDPVAVAAVDARRPGGLLASQDLPEVANCAEGFGASADRLLKGMEIPLPSGETFIDFHEKPRGQMRVKWWANGGRSYRNMALSVPNPDVLPDTPVPELDDLPLFGTSEKPVFVGHYKMRGHPEVDAPHAACLDFPDTPCAYVWRPGDTRIMPERLRIF